MRRRHTTDDSGVVPAARKHATLAVASVALLAAFALAGSAGSVHLPLKRDREAPTAPANVRVTEATPTTVSLAWDASTDNVGVAFYYVYVDAQRTRVEGTTYTASNLECGQSIGVWIVAYDFARNRSSSATATVSTAACVDTQPPLPPVGFRQAATTETAVVLEWDESL
ncbi:MAG: fibronectin type III domain-containing protein, partial [Actinobacteria bacterium]|nr:fibronectin type III domain-containing protein [Actinomycetota bacterium]